ncbi:aldehyde dehydrogenase family protein, partial [Phocaeicola dorei]|uniref:aldehyde dehydrogenase family protein n=1 Tax=Phocaeicola dorei TaxID=357276 RepID=UPI001BDF0863
GMRWPYGPVGLITPFNFTLEIPALQVIGALMMGNKPLVHVDHRSITICTRSSAGMVSILRVSDVDLEDETGRHRTDNHPA